MELPTYTSIWRIEKRLYKLYDFRLPMPLPVGQIAVFSAFTVPYVLLLALFGLPFSHTLFWLYVLPPGILTWLATRPVLESKRLPELIASQLRYLGEPAAWCRMAPLAEKEEIAVYGRVWRRQPLAAAAVAGGPAGIAAPGAEQETAGVRGPADTGPPGPAMGAGQRGRGWPGVRVPGWAACQAPPSAGQRQAVPPARPGHTGGQVPGRAAPARARGAPGQGWPERAPGQGWAGGDARAPGPGWPDGEAGTTAPGWAAAPVPAEGESRAGVSPGGGPAAPARTGNAHPAGTSQAAAPPVVVVPPRQPPVVERALSGPGGRQAGGWRAHVRVVPGGQGPGRPDPVKEAGARVQLPLDGPRLAVVLGCTVGAGQTVTALMLADLLARLRGEPVAALDLNPGPASLTELAGVPAVPASALLGPRIPTGQPAHAAPRRGHGAQRGLTAHRNAVPRADVICDDPAVTGGALSLSGHGAAAAEHRGRLFEFVAGRYRLTVADPGAAAVARVLWAADQLVLVAPASPDAARAVGMTLEWLGANGHGELSARSIAVLNGVSQRSDGYARQAETVVRGRCRAIVRVPWDGRLAEPGPERGLRGGPAAGVPSRLDQLRPAVLAAYTALAGVLVGALASDGQRGRAAR